ncbi:phasin family protein [Amaricoccus sp.]|uniref:phasin family protein n=1 Tax=Amaricoccus sp. TaxID=1872485 RepID=UPI0026103892|nr:phasin family protein [Amaricoccus sp.]HRO09926.1 phasin family protein [Amaricoccus sp.]
MTTTIDTIDADGTAERTRLERTREIAAGIGGAVQAGGKAYVAGLFELGRTLGEIGGETLRETGEHLRTSIRAGSLRELAELQAAYAQNRLEMSATHAKEFVDIARYRTEEVVAPIADLLRRDKAE